MANDNIKYAHESGIPASSPIESIPEEIPVDVQYGPPISSFAYAAAWDPSNGDTHEERAIRLHAYELWEQAGRPEGVNSSGISWADHFWFEAQNQLSRLTGRLHA